MDGTKVTFTILVVISMTIAAILPTTDATTNMHTEEPLLLRDNSKDRIKDSNVTIAYMTALTFSPGPKDSGWTTDPTQKNTTPMPKKNKPSSHDVDTTERTTSSFALNHDIRKRESDVTQSIKDYGAVTSRSIPSGHSEVFSSTLISNNQNMAEHMKALNSPGASASTRKPEIKYKESATITGLSISASLDNKTTSTYDRDVSYGSTISFTYTKQELEKINAASTTDTTHKAALQEEMHIHANTAVSDGTIHGLPRATAAIETSQKDDNFSTAEANATTIMFTTLSTVKSRPVATTVTTSTTANPKPRTITVTTSSTAKQKSTTIKVTTPSTVQTKPRATIVTTPSTVNPKLTSKTVTTLLTVQTNPTIIKVTTSSTVKPKLTSLTVSTSSTVKLKPGTIKVATLSTVQTKPTTIMVTTPATANPKPTSKTVTTPSTVQMNPATIKVTTPSIVKQEPTTTMVTTTSAVQTKQTRIMVTTPTVNLKPTTIMVTTPSTIKPKPKTIAVTTLSTVMPNRTTLMMTISLPIKSKPTSKTVTTVSTVQPKPTTIMMNTPSYAKQKPTTITVTIPSPVKSKPTTIMVTTLSTVKPKSTTISMTTTSKQMTEAIHFAETNTSKHNLTSEKQISLKTVNSTVDITSTIGYSKESNKTAGENMTTQPSTESIETSTTDNSTTTKSPISSTSFSMLPNVQWGTLKLNVTNNSLQVPEKLQIQQPTINPFLDDDTYWPVAMALTIGIPSIIVFAVTITVLHRMRKSKFMGANMYRTL